MARLQKKLELYKGTYGLTTSDLSVLLGVNRSTVLAWERGVIPLSYKTGVIERRLRAIYMARKSLPVPLTVSQFDRKRYLLAAVEPYLDAKYDLPPRISKPRSSAGEQRA